MRSWWVVAIVLCTGTLAHAQAPSEADTHLERGKHLYEIQDYDGAIAEYQAGYLIEQRAEFLYGIGQAYRMKGDCERATRSYTAVIRAADGAPLAEAARHNIDRCHPAVTPLPPPPDQPPPPPQPKPVPPPPPTTPWYRDTLGDALVVGGVVLIAGGAITWKVGRSEADRTYDPTTYDAWVTSSHDAKHASALQSFGIGAAAVGGVAVLGGVLRYVWPKEPRADMVVTPTGATAAVSFTF